MKVLRVLLVALMTMSVALNGQLGFAAVDGEATNAGTGTPTGDTTLVNVYNYNQGMMASIYNAENETYVIYNGGLEDRVIRLIEGADGHMHEVVVMMTKYENGVIAEKVDVLTGERTKYDHLGRVKKTINGVGFVTSENFYNENTGALERTDNFDWVSLENGESKRQRVSYIDYEKGKKVAVYYTGEIVEKTDKNGNILDKNENIIWKKDGEYYYRVDEDGNRLKFSFNDDEGKMEASADGTYELRKDADGNWQVINSDGQRIYVQKEKIGEEQVLDEYGEPILINDKPKMKDIYKYTPLVEGKDITVKEKDDGTVIVKEGDTIIEDCNPASVALTDGRSVDTYWTEIDTKNVDSRMVGPKGGKLAIKYNYIGNTLVSVDNLGAGEKDIAGTTYYRGGKAWYSTNSEGVVISYNVYKGVKAYKVITLSAEAGVKPEDIENYENSIGDESEWAFAAFDVIGPAVESQTYFDNYGRYDRVVDGVANANVIRTWTYNDTTEAVTHTLEYSLDSDSLNEQITQTFKPGQTMCSHDISYVEAGEPVVNVTVYDEFNKARITVMLKPEQCNSDPDNPFLVVPAYEKKI